jgi:hypothetical protein
MYKRSLEISLVILLFLNLSCATTKNYEEMLDSWIGMNISELISLWGDPSHIYLRQDGTRVYVYSRRTLVDEGNRHPTEQYYCITEFETDYRDIITKWKYKGNKCVSKPRY